MTEGAPEKKTGGIKVAVAGASGYVGGELLRLLLAHPSVEIGVLAGESSAGTLLGEHHPHLIPIFDRKIEALDPSNLFDHDVVLLALPHGHSSEIAAILHAETLVIDCAADHRLVSEEDWQEFYGGDYAASWPYGLPELPGARQTLTKAKRIAAPGCYPTAATLALAPALTNDLIAPDVVIVAASGTSGAGRSAKTNLLGSEVMGAMTAYGAGGVHRHTPEIRQLLTSLAGESVVTSFTPTLAPMSRGILATCTAHVNDGVTTSDLRDAYRTAYDDEEFVTVLPEGNWPSTGSTLGSNMAHIQVAIDTHAQRLVAVSAIDNLTKGSAGNAIQSMNIAFGLPEQEGLTAIGVAP